MTAPYTIDRIPLLRPAFTPGRSSPISLLVWHATAGRYPSDLRWLRQGGASGAPVSVHYYIAPDGAITQLVDDADTAWHAGVSAWQGLETRYPNGMTSVNPCSIGVELSHSNAPHEPHAPAQLLAAIWLGQRLVARYRLTPDRVVRHLDVAPGRKTDPAALPWPAFRDALFRRSYTEHSPILDAPPAGVTASQIAERIVPRADMRAYTIADIRVIVDTYWQRATSVGIDPLIPLAQMCHETGWLTSFWSQRPQRNPAGIGVTGEHSPHAQDGYAYNPQRQRYERGLSFPTWVEHAIPAHLGRLLAYAIHDAHATPSQRALIAEALRVRPLPDACRGSASTLRALGRAHNPERGCGWAVPGIEYGVALAQMAMTLQGD